MLLPAGLAARLQGRLEAAAWRSAIGVWHGWLPEPGVAEDATGVVLWHRDPATLCRNLLDHAPRLDWVHSLWTGLEHLPLDDLLERRVIVTTGRGTPSGPLAEWALLAVLWALKRVPANRRLLAVRRWEQLEVKELAGSRVVVLGLGSIGSAVAGMLARQDARVIGVRRTPGAHAACESVVAPENLADACRRAAALIVAVPLTTQTRGMVDGAVLAALPDGAVVVNLARGPVITERALFAEVDSGRLLAALDAWWQEPLPHTSPWWALDNVLVSPHAAYLTPGHRDRHAARAWENIERYIEGKDLVSIAGPAEMRAMIGV